LGLGPLERAAFDAATNVADLFAQCGKEAGISVNILEATTRKQALYKQLSSGEPITCVLTFIQDAAKAGARLALATESNPEHARAVLTKLSMLQHVGCIVTNEDGDDARARLLAATRGLGLSPSVCCAIDCRESTLAAAVSLGMQVMDCRKLPGYLPDHVPCDVVAVSETAKRPIERGSARVLGTVASYNKTRGFGFITPDEAMSDGDLFVHQSQIRGAGYRFLVVGQRVEFTSDPDDAKRAIDVKTFGRSPGGAARGGPRTRGGQGSRGSGDGRGRGRGRGAPAASGGATPLGLPPT